ncbi:MAG: DUF2339 domain-containing protein, partial [Novosphingobium sp.]
ESAHSAPPMQRAAINFEELFGRKLPIWAGGITLAIAGVLIVKYAIDAGLFGRIFTPGVQAICGFLFGLGLIAGAEWAHRQRDKVNDPRVSQALSGAGISTLYAALLVAANVYHLISPLTAFLGLAAVTVGALWLSLRHGMPSALLGLAGGLAAPALTVGMDANVPMLATYLGFTIAGLVGVSRIQRWPWLAAFALLGGAGWSLWLILAGQALTVLGSLSIGGFVLLLAIAAPLVAFREAGAALLRTVAAIVGAVQLAILVAIGGYDPLHWGIFVLIAAAGQWLAWRERDFAIVPTIGAALSVLLLMLWPNPSGDWLATFALSLAAIHALPLLVRLWQQPPVRQRAVELSAIAMAAPLIMWRHYPADDMMIAMAAAGGGLLALIGAASGWKAADRLDDSRFALLLATAGGLLVLAAWSACPHWQIPLWSGAIALALLFLSRPAADWRIEPLAAAFSGLALGGLVVTIPPRFGELSVLVGWHIPGHDADTASLLRWAGLALVFALFAWRAERPANRFAAWGLTTGLAYGVCAQLLPGWTLPLAMAGVTAATLLTVRHREEPAVESQLLLFGAAAVALLGLTGPHPIGEWLRLADAGDAGASGLALLRWAGVAALGGLFAARSRLPLLCGLGQAGAMLLAYGACAQVVPGWTLPLAMAAVAAIALFILNKRGSAMSEVQVMALLAGAIGLLAISGTDPRGECLRLIGEGDGLLSGAALARWAGVAALAGLLAVRSRLPMLRHMGQGTAALLGYGALAQIVPLVGLPLVAPLACLGLALWSRYQEWPHLRTGFAVLAGIVAGWAFVPMVTWFDEALRSLGGVPMMLDSADLVPLVVARCLLFPALLLGASLWSLRPRIERSALRVGAGVVGVLGMVALHSLYRAGFAAVFGGTSGGDFMTTGLGERLLWCGLLIAAAVILSKRAGGAMASLAAPALLLTAGWHVLWYSLLLHNPLWSEQAVGALPVLNLIAPLFAAVPLCVILLARIRPDHAARIDHVLQPVLMVMVAMFGWASLRQAFHGTFLTRLGLTTPGTGQLEDILRSILGIVLAIGFLLWGIRQSRHNWRIASLVLMLAAVAKVFLRDASGLEGLLRIASFVALGFSLIGIGWLYSRQLRRNEG